MATQNENNKILIVDDSAINRAILTDMLNDKYDILEACDGVEAIKTIHKYADQLSLVLLDVVMPNLDGFEVLTLMNKYHWIEEIPVIMISAENSHSIIERAYELGASDYINRPFDEVIVLRRVINTIMLYKKQRNLVSMVANQVYETEKSNNLMVSILSHIVEFRNGESGLHVLHIGTITHLILKQLAKKTNQYELTPNKISLISKASAFHDIGKIAIDEKILNKPGRLTPEEFTVIKTHSSIGAKMLKEIPIYNNDELVKYAYQICRWHHERFDGSGYPDGLVGNDIPIAAQAVSIADAYDALISERVYKKAYSHEKALNMIINGECGVFNPLLLECLEEMKDIIEKELTICSYGNMSMREIDNISQQLMNKHTISCSSRTLNLLEEEKIKYEFFASLSSDILFEYTKFPNMLTLSQWGAKAYNVPPVILNPLSDTKLTSVISSEDLINIKALLNKTRMSDPYIEYEVNLTLEDHNERKLLIARTLWNKDDPNEYSGAIGKLIEFNGVTHNYIKAMKTDQKDVLTNLYNKAKAEKEISTVLSTCVNEDYALLLIDLYYFKQINSIKGRLSGDRLLKYVAQKLIELRADSHTIIARIGGDEFLLFTKLDNVNDNFIHQLFTTMQASLEDIDIDINIGISTTKTNGKDIATLLKCADRALTCAKAKGKGHYCYADQSLTPFTSNISLIDN